MFVNIIIYLYFSADDASILYYRNILSCVCGGAAVLGLILTLALPKMFTHSSSINGKLIIYCKYNFNKIHIFRVAYLNPLLYTMYILIV